MSVRDMLKAVAVVSGNDATVALAEHLYGSEEAFVAQMNQRAQELGMANTTFQNSTGLPAQGHVTTAYDIALMSRALMAYPEIQEFTTIWMDTLREGAFGLSNTNQLIRFYPGATGLKTGSTDSALYCLSASAQREGMHLIAVVLKAPTSQVRFDSAKSLLDYGFANYALVPIQLEQAIPPVSVHLGEETTVQPVPAQLGSLLVPKSQAGMVSTQMSLTSSVEAPVEQGQTLGEVQVLVGDEVRQTVPLVAHAQVARLSVPGIFGQFLNLLFIGN